MTFFSSEQATASAMIHQLIYLWARELDRNNGVEMGPLLAPDCAYMTRGSVAHGPKAVLEFYRARLAELNATPAGPPVHRHVISNLLVAFEEDGSASVEFLLVYFAGFGTAPITNLDGPVAVADVQMRCSRGTDGHWRIASFDSQQNFVKAPK